MNETIGPKPDTIKLKQIDVILPEDIRIAIKNKLTDEESIYQGSVTTKSGGSFIKNFNSKLLDVSLDNKTNSQKNNEHEDLEIDYEQIDVEEKKTTQILTVEPKVVKRKRTKRKNPKAPKQPMSAYNFYVKEKLVLYRQRYADFDQKAIMRQIAADWKN